MKSDPLDVFEELLELLNSITEDERIPAPIRYEILGKILAIGKKHGIRMEG